MTAVARVGGRVLLLNPAGEVLLIHERYDDGAGIHWITPGGGVEPGEDPAEAAARELVEEIGLRVEIPAGQRPVLVTHRLWQGGGVTYPQRDHYYVVRVEQPVEIAPAALTDSEQAALLGFAWWNAAQLAQTDERVVPPELSQLLPRLTR